ncbi:MAG TPA: GIY-YIG nuclease family protein [Chloroflexota bacterium]
MPHLPACAGLSFSVYVLASHARVLYTGVTNNLERRVFEHRAGAIPGFTSKYNVHRLVYFEDTEDLLAAMAREKQIKAWTRAKRVALIESMNPTWQDLAADWFDAPSLSFVARLRVTAQVHHAAP